MKPALVVAALELLLPGLHLGGLARGQLLQLFVVFVQIHAAALPGIHDLLFRHPAK